MSSNLNMSLFNTKIFNVSSIEMLILYGITISGILVNLLTMLYLLIIAAYRMKSSCFLFHHCLICLTLSILCLPYSLSFLNYSIRCNYLANIQVTCVTAQLLNMAAMVASEAYRFEDLIHQDTPPEKDTQIINQHQHNHYQYQLKQSNKSTISCGCLSFGILIIWFSSVILHLGITMIGSESKSYYDSDSRYCNFLIRDIRGYVLTLMWIIIIVFSLIITLRYIHKILGEVSLKRRNNQPLLSLAILGQSHGQSIASRDILMQQIEQRLKLNILLIIIFIIFWFPLFILTLFNIKFELHKQILRYLMLLAWSNSSVSPLTYLLLLPKCSDLCRLCCRKDRSSTYDSLTSYYNRIGDRFHDIGKWDQIKTDQFKTKNNNSKKIKQYLNENENENENENDNEHENETDDYLNKINSFKLNKFNKISSDYSDESHTKSNSIIVKEMQLNDSDSSSLTTVTTKQQHHQLSSNGLIVTSNKRTHF
ncbi:unnamed protein product [Adineta steineri]|uniref:G-protein coupled receptors family 1 profile domain-containing protein n=2 Tax=Adineta steineri TaxID=433720 RepID=A0A815DQG2_9BILA|nr:unnamed protein product [Adineta steineri]